MSEAFTSLDGWLLRTSLAGGIVLLVGSLWMLLTKQPVQRQRIGESALLAALLVALPAALPSWWSIPGTAANSTTHKAVFGSEPLVFDAKSKPQADTRPMEVTDVSDHETELFELAGILKALEQEQEDRDAASQGIQLEKPEGEQCTKSSMFAMPGDWFRWMLRITGIAYMGLVLVLLTRCLIGYYGLWQYWRQRRPAPAHVHLALSELEPDPSCRPRIGVNAMVHGPVSYGLWKQTILLPPHFCNEGDPEKLRWILAHELTHLRRRDAWGCLLLAVGGAFYFHVPWFWWMKRHVRLAQEYLADAAAVQIANAVEYAQYLVSLTALTSRPTLASSQAASVFESPSDLYRRVHMLLNQRSSLERGAPRWWTVTAAASFLALATCASGLKLFADEPEKVQEVRVVVVDDDAKKSDGKKTEKTFTIRGDAKVKPDGKGLHWVVDDKDGKSGVFHVHGVLSDDKMRQLDEAMKKLEQVLEKLPKQIDGETRAKLEELKKTIKSMKDTNHVYLKHAADAAKEADGVVRLKLADAVKQGEEHRKKALEALAEVRLKQVQSEKDRAVAAEKLARVAQEKALTQWKEAKDGDSKDKAIRELERAIAEKERALKAMKETELKNVTKTIPMVRSFQTVKDKAESSGNKGRLGVVVADIDSNLRNHLDLAANQGVMINEVIDSSPAWNNGNGLRSSDILLELGGKKVPASQDQFRELVSKLDAGTINAVVLRKGKKVTVNGIKLPAAEKASKVVWDVNPGDLKVNLALQPELNKVVSNVVPLHVTEQASGLLKLQPHVTFQPSEIPGRFVINPNAVTSFTPQAAVSSKPRLGVTLEEVPEAIATQLELGEDRGLLVKEVQEGTAASKAGILKNDILIEFADKPVTRDHEAFSKFVKTLSAGKYNATVVRKGKEIRIREINIADVKSADEERKAKVKEWQVEGDEKMKEERKDAVKNKLKESVKKPKDDFFPNANRGLNFARNAGNTSMTINNDQFTATRSHEGKVITVKGKMVSGKAQPASITIKTDDEEKKYASLKEVPEEDRAEVEKMLSGFRGNAFVWNAGNLNFNNQNFNRQFEEQIKIMERAMKQLGEGNPGFEQMEKEMQRLREQLKRLQGSKNNKDDDEN